MNILRARRILGKSSKHITDQEILAIIESLNKIIEVGFQQFEKRVRFKTNRN